VQPLGKDLREFLSLLGKHEVRFLVVGGFALAAHGVPRYTKDIDIWLDASEDNARKVLLALEEFGFASLGLEIQDFTTPDLVIQLGYEPNRIDLLTGLTGVQFDEAYPKRIANMIDGVSIWIIDRASLIANKRAFGRPQDLVDATELEK